MLPSGRQRRTDVAGNITEDQMLLDVIPDRPFCKLKAAADLLDLNIIADDGAESLIANFYVHCVLREC